ncbi:MAG: tRNA (guanosine(46)-N7)-methyltransferase TrmB [Bacteroidetes bacterium]|nr:tRNA (guanosine(46)-N7)-methyltransferase TrmB [Bacteroidota bacterium]
MGKNKLKHFAENETFPILIQPTLEEVKESFYLKGNWSRFFFRNNHPIVLELGCGKGEYTVALARKYPEKNFIGIDRKGARMWRGSKTATVEELKNAGFLRTRIEFLNHCFGRAEINEIWITFPDPQPKKSKSKRRLTSTFFLDIYRDILVSDGIIHLKTDNEGLYQFTKETIMEQNHILLFGTEDLYSSEIENEATEVKTYYETRFLIEGSKIKYLRFKLNKVKNETEGKG